MAHIRYGATAPFQFETLDIRELTPDDLSSASVAEVTVPSGASHRRARSTKCDKLYVCLAGEIAFRVDGREIRLLPNDVLSISRNHWFAYANENPVEARLLLVHVPPFDLAAEEFAEGQAWRPIRRRPAFVDRGECVDRNFGVIAGFWLNQGV